MSDKWGRMVVLTDQVEAVDKTPDMTHVHVAEHINSLINKTREGINIGIEGGWGTGKSTVVAILLDLLKKTSENFAFYFDAWAHEGDHLRRAFLESLTDEILRLEGISDAIRTNLNHQKDLISNRIVRHEVRRKTTLTLSQGQDVDLIRRIVEKLGRRVRLSREARQAIKKSFRSCEH